MGFMTPTLPDVDIETWRALPRGDRVAISTRHWVEHGFGSPTAVYLLYVVKCAFYVAGAALVISFTPGIGSVFDIGTWWDAPIVYQKLIVWTLLYEVIGLGCGSGPLTSKFNPPIGSILYWLRPGHHPAAALARPGARHPRRPAYRPRRRAVRRRARLRRLAADPPRRRRDDRRLRQHRLPRPARRRCR